MLTAELSAGALRDAIHTAGQREPVLGLSSAREEPAPLLTVREAVDRARCSTRTITRALALGAPPAGQPAGRRGSARPARAPREGRDDDALAVAAVLLPGLCRFIACLPEVISGCGVWS